MCHRTVSDALGPYRCQLDTLRKTEARSAIIHWTVRCASGATTICAQRSTLIDEQCHDRSQKGTGLSGVAPDCPVPQEDKASNGRPALNPNGWVMWRRTGKQQCLSGGTPGCPVRPSPAASSTTTKVVGGYKYPQPPQPFASKFFRDHIQYKS
jgi:hypothetical protein